MIYHSLYSKASHIIPSFEGQCCALQVHLFQKCIVCFNLKSKILALSITDSKMLGRFMLLVLVSGPVSGTESGEDFTLSKAGALMPEPMACLARERAKDLSGLGFNFLM